MNYFIVWSSEDRELGIDGPLSKEEAEKRVLENHYGDLDIYSSPEDLGECEEGYGRGMVIIKGEAVMPKTIETVTRIEL